MAGEIRPADVGRRRRNRAIDKLRHTVAIAGEGTAQIGDQRMPLPVGDCQKFRRDHPEWRAVRIDQATWIGLVTAAQFDRGLDQEAAGVIAHCSEWIDIDRQRLAGRLADGRTRHRSRHRRAIRRERRRRRNTSTRIRVGRAFGLRRYRRARSRGSFGLGLAGIKLRRLALAVKGVESGLRGAARRRLAIGRNRTDPRRRRRRLVLALCIAGIGRLVGAVVAGLVAGLAQKRILRREKAVANRAHEIGGQGLGLEGRGHRQHRKARQRRAQQRHALAVAGRWPRHHDGNTPTNSDACLNGHGTAQKTSLTE